MRNKKQEALALSLVARVAPKDGKRCFANREIQATDFVCD
jgi:hypothetical protein